jgi:catechol 2,3-dioxygenase-like lactoylglutathione lyase family enzyme
MGTDKNPFKFTINQLGIAVKDIEKTSAFLENIGIGPFETMDVESEESKFKIGLFQQEGLQIELVQHVQGEAGAYSKFVKEKREGIHHVGYWVKDFDEALQKMKDLGIKVLADGDVYGVRYCYLDTEKQCGFIVELIEGS